MDGLRSDLVAARRAVAAAESETEQALTRTCAPRPDSDQIGGLLPAGLNLRARNPARRRNWSRSGSRRWEET